MKERLKGSLELRAKARKLLMLLMLLKRLLRVKPPMVKKHLLKLSPKKFQLKKKLQPKKKLQLKKKRRMKRLKLSQLRTRKLQSLPRRQKCMRMLLMRSKKIPMRLLQKMTRIPSQDRKARM